MALSRRAHASEIAGVSQRVGCVGPLHSLHHSHVFQLIDAGVDAATSSKRIGHASPAMTLRVYAHLFRKDDGTAAMAVVEAMASMRVS